MRSFAQGGARQRGMNEPFTRAEGIDPFVNIRPTTRDELESCALLLETRICETLSWATPPDRISARKPSQALPAAFVAGLA
jgi:hypothetical protein